MDSAVSTHAPLGRYVTRYAKYNALKFQSARGATYRCRPLSRGFLVSIHAPMAIRPASSSSFNPRARAGRDALKEALAYRILGFNPRARAGRDQRERLARLLRMRFQSTRPRGARRFQVSFERRTSLFQSTRPRGARRACIVCPYMLSYVSIHAPARGATKPSWASFAARRVSIHAPARGATRLHRMPLHAVLRFNPRARAGRD